LRFNARQPSHANRRGVAQGAMTPRLRRSYTAAMSGSPTPGGVASKSHPSKKSSMLCL